MEGIATRVQRHQEGGATVLQFVLVTDNGTRAAVEMRGKEVRGPLDDGDRVHLPANGDLPRDGLYRPRAVENLTVNVAVQAWMPPLWRRATAVVGMLFLSAVVSSTVTLVFASIFTLGADSPGDGAPGARGDDDDTAAILIVALVVGLILSLLSVILLRRRARHLLLPSALGIAVGIAFVVVGVLVS